MKGKERVPVPVAGPAFRGGVKFVIFYVFGSFLQPAAKIDPIQSALPPVSNPSLDKKEKTNKQKKKAKKEEGQETRVRQSPEIRGKRKKRDIKTEVPQDK